MMGFDRRWRGKANKLKPSPSSDDNGLMAPAQLRPELELAPPSSMPTAGDPKEGPADIFESIFNFL